MSDTPLAAVIRNLRSLAVVERFRDRTDGELLKSFAVAHDQDAFTALVRRHGPLVLAVCRRALRQAQDAEDTFQATFLLLARKAGSIRKPASLAGWLHGVAYRMAQNAKRSAAARRRHEAKASSARPADPAREAAWREVQVLLDEEIQRLPARYRTPFILCHLEGHGPAEAAHRLGVKEGTVRSWLSRAREVLRKRLAKQGVELSLALAAVGVSSAPAAVVVPGSLVAATVEAAALYATQGVTATASVAALLKGVNQAMLLGKVKLTTFLVLAATVAGAGIGGVTYQRTVAQGADKVAQAAPVRQRELRRLASAPVVPAALPKEDTVAISGRVLDPEGKPFEGAKLYVAFQRDFALEHRPPPAVRATSQARGRFQLSVPKAEFDESKTQVVALAPGYGPGWVELERPEAAANLTLQLVKDDVPINGRVLDLQGRPLSGITVHVRWIEATPTQDLSAWIAYRQAAFRSQNKRIAPQLPSKAALSFLLNQHASGLPRSVTTDSAGRFRLQGAGRERVVHLQLEGPAIGTGDAYVLTRPGKLDSGEAQLYCATFGYVATSAKPISGTVRDKRTGEPLSGIRVACSGVFARTDEKGEYKLAGVSKAKQYFVDGWGVPFIYGSKMVDDTPDLAPIVVDLQLERALTMRARIVDKQTGKPAPGAFMYFAAANNPHLKDYPSFTAPPVRIYWEFTEPDGSFTVTAVPGPGFLCVQAQQNRYTRAEAPEGSNSDARVIGGVVPGMILLDQYHAAVAINPSEKDPKSLVCEIALDPGRTLSGSVVGPDGQPLTGTFAAGLYALALPMGLRTRSPERLENASFTAVSLNPRKPRTLCFLHPEKKLAGALLVRGDEKEPLTVRLAPFGTVTGRLVDAEGRPRARVKVSLAFTPRQSDLLPAAVVYGGLGPFFEEFRNSTTTDDNGRFRLQRVVTGLRYDISAEEKESYVGSAGKDFFTEAGESKDLGDLQLRPPGGKE
jgi:RNA polymerase sigma factor (sigma-70 family)